MANSGKGSPYRAPCWGWGGLPTYFGGCKQHKVQAHSHVEILQNTTQVPACGDSSPSDDPPCSGGTIGAPYTRTAVTADTSDFCAGSPCCCNPWPKMENTYASYSPKRYADFSACEKYGFKNLYARKYWHGMPGYLQTIGCDPDDTPVTTHYRTRTIDLQFHLNSPSAIPPVDATAHVTRTWTVDRYSGKFTLSDCLDDYPSPLDFPSVPPYFDYPQYLTLKDMFTAMAGISYQCGAWIGPTGGTGMWNPGIINALNDPDYPTALYYPTDVTMGVYSALTTKEVGDTHLKFVFITAPPTAVYPYDTPAYTEQLTVEITLSDPYTASDVNDDIKALLAEWDLCDDLQYPWRLDGNCTSGPLVTYYESGPWSPALHGLEDCSWTDPTPCDGSILGAPNTPGAEPWFNFLQNVYTFDGGSDTWTPTGYGEAAPSWALNATQWTTGPMSANMPPGGFSQGSQNGLLVGCWAEAIIPTYSHNFARPCGAHDTAERVAATQTCDGATTTYEGDFLYPVARCYCNDTSQVRTIDDGSCHSPPCACDAPANPAATDQWNDVGRKGDFVVHVWEFDYRTAASRSITGAWSSITANQLCAAASACRPFAVFISPVDPECSTGTWVQLPDSSCDQAGALWQALPRQWMADPLWVPPIQSCGDIDAGKAWAEDDGSCLADTDDVSYYPMRPWEEARATVPTGAPALPSGCFLDPAPLSVSDINSGTSGNILSPPSNGSCPSPMPWVICQRQQDCIAATGSFAGDYAAAAEERTLDLPLI